MKIEAHYIGQYLAVKVTDPTETDGEVWWVQDRHELWWQDPRQDAPVRLDPSMVPGIGGERGYDYIPLPADIQSVDISVRREADGERASLNVVRPEPRKLERRQNRLMQSFDRDQLSAFGGNCFLTNESFEVDDDGNTVAHLIAASDSHSSYAYLSTLVAYCGVDLMKRNDAGKTVFDVWLENEAELSLIDGRKITHNEMLAEANRLQRLPYPRYQWHPRPVQEPSEEEIQRRIEAARKRAAEIEAEKMAEFEANERRIAAEEIGRRVVAGLEDCGLGEATSALLLEQEVQGHIDHFAAKGHRAETQWGLVLMRLRGEDGGMGDGEIAAWLEKARRWRWRRGMETLPKVQEALK